MKFGRQPAERLANGEVVRNPLQMRVGRGGVTEAERLEVGARLIFGEVG